MLKPGLRLFSAVCDAQVMVIRSAGGGELTCGGKPMVEHEPEGRAEGDPEQMLGCLMGKRYVSQTGDIEILCVRTGQGSLYYNDEELVLKGAKALPSSD